MLSLGLSASSWSGADVAGFIGGASPELMTRWYEIAAFTPVFRSHFATTRRAPNRGRWPRASRDPPLFHRGTHRLLPYLYAVAEERAHRRPGDAADLYDYPAMASRRATIDGIHARARPALAASPKPEQPRATISAAGKGWYDIGRATVGSERISETPNRPPAGVRTAGAILPSQPLCKAPPKFRRALESTLSGNDCRRAFTSTWRERERPSLRQTTPAASRRRRCAQLGRARVAIVPGGSKSRDRTWDPVERLILRTSRARDHRRSNDRRPCQPRLRCSPSRLRFNLSAEVMLFLCFIC